MTRLLITVAIVTLAWTASSVGYFWLAPILQADIGYNDAPIFYTFYYAFWAAAVYLLFRKAFLDWTRMDAPAEYAGILGVMFVVFTGYALFILPRLPTAVWNRSVTPVEFFSANSWYFLPKSLEILFQQVMIAALVLALNALTLSLRTISILVAVLFGGFHLSLAFSYDNPFYVLRYTIAATIFGAIVPYLILRLRNGFLLSYAIHWSFYALDLTIIHLVFAAE